MRSSDPAERFGSHGQEQVVVMRSSRDIGGHWPESRYRAPTRPVTYLKPTTTSSIRMSPAPTISVACCAWTAVGSVDTSQVPGGSWAT